MSEQKYRLIPLIDDKEKSDSTDPPNWTKINFNLFLDSTLGIAVVSSFAVVVSFGLRLSFPELAIWDILGGLFPAYFIAIYIVLRSNARDTITKQHGFSLWTIPIWGIGVVIMGLLSCAIVFGTLVLIWDFILKIMT